MKNKPKLPKDDFLDIMTSRSPVEINRLIEERGKRTKGVPLVFITEPEKK